MKTDSNKRLLKLVSAEALIQTGFENSTEQALNTISDVLNLYIETLVKKIIPLQECKDPYFLSKILIEETYANEQYQIKEMTGFLNQQIALKHQLKEQYEVEGEESLLHLLKVLPKETSLKSVFRSSKTLTVEEKKSIEIKEEIEIDEFMTDFIEKSSSEPSRKVVGVYLFDCSKIVEDMAEGMVALGRISNKPKEQMFEYKDFHIAEQELLVEDFIGNEKFTILR